MYDPRATLTLLVVNLSHEAVTMHAGEGGEFLEVLPGETKIQNATNGVCMANNHDTVYS